MAKDIIFENAPKKESNVMMKVAPPLSSTVRNRGFKGARRRPLPLIDLSQHYRVPISEKIIEGDEWFDELTDAWVKTTNAGFLVGSTIVYRRRQIADRGK